MQKIANTKFKQKLLFWVSKKMSFQIMQSSGFSRSSKRPNDEAGTEPHGEHCCSGGYNEVFIFEHWASYGPRH